ncbi:MAG: biotin/lipoyl-binding protein, partial [Thermoanaerobaculia bacterium]
MTSIRVFLSVLTLAAALLLVGGCAAGEAETREQTRPVPLVDAVQARSGAIPLSERVSGTVRAENQVAIRAEISAPIVEVMVRSGAEVRRGQPLVRLDDRDVREQLLQAEASVRLAEASAAEAAARVGE